MCKKGNKKTITRYTAFKGGNGLCSKHDYKFIIYTKTLKLN